MSLRGENSLIGKNAAQICPRDYQLEMLEESLQRNIVVAMDTGSGKTYMYVLCDPPVNYRLARYVPPTTNKRQRAVLRIMAELDRCSPEKLIWFLAPTVALCIQQHEVISLQIPAIQTKLLIGSDNMDRWGEQRIWDAALKDIRVVVSTHAVLADALSHGYVRIERLALLIFDEAHHCARGHPANKIMRDFYHPTRRRSGEDAVPHILGLTASPIVRSKLSELQTIETNLNSISRTPRLQRHEMLACVHRPTLYRIDYRRLDENLSMISKCSIRDLISVCGMVEAQQHLCSPKLHTDRESVAGLGSVKSKQKNSTEIQLRKFSNKAQHVYEELGPWAADYFISQSIARLKKIGEIGTGLHMGHEERQKALLVEKLSRIPPIRVRTDFLADDLPQISPKLGQLISFLLKDDDIDFSGLVFVRQRATVIVMTEILSIHPLTKSRFRYGSYVGLSNSGSRKQTIGDLLDVQAQRETLTDFRNGSKNLLITTDVLEEGIDIPACRLVVCYDSPPNLKSLIQRRGRARHATSKFAILVSEDNSSATFQYWRGLEEEMMKICQDDTRLLQEVSYLESRSEPLSDQFRVETTGALLTAEMAVAHLYHFCALLPQQQYVDLRPMFIFTSEPDTDLIMGTVILPNCLISSVRYTRGRGSWLTERAAAKDAAFQAYMTLYRAGLLNEYLLPLTRGITVEGEEQEQIPAIVEVADQFNPWVRLAQAWPNPDLRQTTVSICQEEEVNAYKLRMILTTSGLLSLPRPFRLYWDSDTTFNVRLAPRQQTSSISSDHLRLQREIMHTLLRSTHSDRQSDYRVDYVVLFGPDVEGEHLSDWLNANQGRRPVLEEFQLHPERSLQGLIRDPLLSAAPHVFEKWTGSDVAGENSDIRVSCSPLPKRRNFVQRSTFAERQKKTTDQDSDGISRKVQEFAASSCTVDLLPFEYARFSLFIRAILQHMEMSMAADHLCKTLLQDVPFRDIDLVITAITASSTQWVTNYQRLEFLGDSVLKFVVSGQVFMDHQNWHEGYLSEKRKTLVSNTRLARAALDLGLDVFVLTKSFTDRKWVCPLISDLLEQSTGPRSLASKVLADVVEALIGAAFLDGGLSSARKCTHAFLPAISVQMPNCELVAARDRSRHAERTSVKADDKIERLVGYRFQDKALLVQALTHPSCERDMFTESYQRLEFLGDAVLDMIVVAAMFDHDCSWSHGEMTAIKAALVNADLLAFFCMDTSIVEDTVEIQPRPDGSFYDVHGERPLELWKFMRHHSQEIAKAQQESLGRHQRLHQDVQRHLYHGKTYPWALLAEVNADKFFSDLIESVFGAIFIDSQGSLEHCIEFAMRIGLLPYLRRMTEETIDVTHPKTALGQLAGSNPVEYIVEHDSNGVNEYQCLLRVNGVDVVTIKGCLTKNEAVVKAANAAVGLMSP